MRTSARQTAALAFALGLLLAPPTSVAAQAPEPRAQRIEEAGQEAGKAVTDIGNGAFTPVANSPDIFIAKLAPTLGNEPASQLRMKFEVTFMKIDVADLEARVAPQISALIEPLVRAGERNDEVEDQIAELLMDPSAPILLSMTFCRDSDYGRFSKGLRTSMKQAAESRAITESERDELTQVLLDDSGALEEIGVVKGGALLHYIEGDLVRTIVLTADATVQIDSTRSDATLGRALRASWFEEKSRFRKKLFKSLFE